MQFSLQVVPVTTSTNDEVKCAIEAGAPEGYCVRAVRQEGGYGRQGRAWSSPEGGLYLSVLLRPDVSLSQLPTLSLVVGLAVCDALSSLVVSEEAARLAIKWPNDVVVRTCSEDTERVHEGPGRFQKICGISLEKHRDALCVGIGVNVLPPQMGEVVRQEKLEGKNSCIYLADLGFGFICDREACVDEVAQAVLTRLSAYYTRWVDGGFSAFVSGYDSRDVLAGTTVTVQDAFGGSLAQGVVVGIDEQGRLLIQESTGTIVPVLSGEAHLV